MHKVIIIDMFLPKVLFNVLSSNFQDLKFYTDMNNSNISLHFGFNHTVMHKEVEDTIKNQSTNGPVNAPLISWPSKAQNIQNLENIW